MPLWNDNELRSYLAGLGEVVTVGAANIVGLLRRDYVETARIEGYRPVLCCVTADVADVGHEAAVVVGDQHYVVVNIQPRDDGLTLLVLEERDVEEG